MGIASPRALICGISGQDGAYLAELLLSKGYEVWGTSRNVETNTFRGLKSLGIFDRVRLRSMSPENPHSVHQVFSEISPQEIYNLAGQSSVGLSFELPTETLESITISTSNQLDSIRKLDKSIRFFNAGSSECFGDTGSIPADENTGFHPQSPYAVAKAASTFLVSIYREVYGLFACTGILFNHESPLRPARFVTQKIAGAANRIAQGSDEKLSLGNLDIRRDWGWAPEYVDAMWRMLNHKTAEDFVLATGESQCLESFVCTVFESFGLDWRRYVIIDRDLYRPSDPKEIIGNSEKASRLLDWKPKIRGREVPRKMALNFFG